jgi:hypothetical protein
MGGEESQTAEWCEIIERDLNGNVCEFVGTFSRADAENAKLWGKPGPWSQYPKKMLEWRAFGFAARKAYADRLRGIILAEEAQDIPVERDITPAPAQVASIEQKAEDVNAQKKREIAESVDSAIETYKETTAPSVLKSLHRGRAAKISSDCVAFSLSAKNKQLDRLEAAYIEQLSIIEPQQEQVDLHCTGCGNMYTGSVGDKCECGIELTVSEE